MTESLVVDAARLKSAGITVRDQVLPTPPAPISATGADAVSAAINTTMPIIETPVSDGLRDVQAAATNVGAKIVTAADLYAQTDQLHSESVAQVQFLASSADTQTNALADQPVSAKKEQPLGAAADNKDDKKDDGKKPTPKPQPTPTSIDFSQVSALTQGAQPVTQGMQTLMSRVQQAASGAGTAGASSPAKLADDTKKGGPDGPDDKAQLVDATTKDAEGAAAGGKASGGAPVQSVGRSETPRSETQL